MWVKVLSYSWSMLRHLNYLLFLSFCGLLAHYSGAWAHDAFTVYTPARYTTRHGLWLFRSQINRKSEQREWRESPHMWFFSVLIIQMLRRRENMFDWSWFSKSPVNLPGAITRPLWSFPHYNKLVSAVIMGWGFKEDDYIFTFDLHVLKMRREFRRGAQF